MKLRTNLVIKKLKQKTTTATHFLNLQSVEKGEPNRKTYNQSEMDLEQFEQLSSRLDS